MFFGQIYPDGACVLGVGFLWRLGLCVAEFWWAKLSSILESPVGVGVEPPAAAPGVGQVAGLPASNQQKRHEYPVHTKGMGALVALIQCLLAF